MNINKNYQTNDNLFKILVFEGIIMVFWLYIVRNIFESSVYMVPAGIFGSYVLSALIFYHRWYFLPLYLGYMVVRVAFYHVPIGFYSIFLQKEQQYQVKVADIGRILLPALVFGESYEKNGSIIVKTHLDAHQMQELIEDVDL